MGTWINITVYAVNYLVGIKRHVTRWGDSECEDEKEMELRSDNGEQFIHKFKGLIGTYISPKKESTKIFCLISD